MSAATSPTSSTAAAPAARSATVARAALALLALGALVPGFAAAFAPRSFYDHFPFTAHWVDRLPPYNAHLVTDVGAFYLAFAVVFAWAAWTLQRDLVWAACAGWALFSLLHLVFHATHLDGFGTADAVGELASLAAVLALPALAAWAVGRPIKARGTADIAHDVVGDGEHP